MKKSLFLFLLVGFFFLPGTVLADSNDVKINVKNSYMGQPYVVMDGYKGVTNIGDIKEYLEDNYDIDFNNYILSDSNSFDAYADNTFICEGIPCYGPMNPGTENEYYEASVYLIALNHNETKFELKSIPASSENMFMGLVQVNYDLFGNLSYSSCNSTFDLCSFKDSMNLTLYDNVVIDYQYDSDIQVLAQAIVSSGLLNKTKFTATDTEFLNYLNYGGLLADYSSDLKNQLGNTNFTFQIDVGMGAMEPFETHEGGFNKFLYDGVIYAINDLAFVYSDHIIYVPTDTTDNVAALENRLTDLFGTDVHLSVTESTKTVNELLDDFGLPPVSDGDVKYYILENINTDSPYCGMQTFVKVVRDSSKINNSSSFISNDLLTNILVSTDSSIPLDTIMRVKGISSGEDYDNIIGVLKVDDVEMYDISLFSNNQNKKIEKLDNGNFLVSIPIPERFKGKQLIIYYVDSSNNIQEHVVNVVDGEYAQFETDHFSIYSLALNPNVSNSGTSNANPNTGDNIIMFITILGISLVGIVISKKRI